MTQPGSLRDSAVSFSKSAATSDSRPVFAIQVTASTTIIAPFLRSLSVLGSSYRALDWLQAQLAHKIRHQDRLLTIGPGGNHADTRSRFLFDESEIFASGFG